MSERDDSGWQKAVRDYVSGGRHGKPVFQMNFLEIVERPGNWIAGTPEATLPEIYRQFSEIIQAVRRIYIPEYTPSEAELLDQGYAWTKAYPKEFIRKYVNAGNEDRLAELPASVFLNIRSLALPFTLRRPRNLRDLPLSEKVAFKPGSKAFLDDVRSVTLGLHERIHSRHFLEGRQAKAGSGTYDKELITKFYMSGGKPDDPSIRSESIDIISWDLAIVYYANLIRRLKLAKQYGAWY